jgi:excisionase family DNA binding protein
VSEEDQILPEKLLTATEVADLFRVDSKTVGRWAKAGKIDFVRTLGGHYRFKESVCLRLLRGLTEE